MLPFFLGLGVFGEWFDNLLKGSGSGNSEDIKGFTSDLGDYSAVSVDEILLTVLRINEGASGQAVEKAYPLKGETGYTIGYGSKFLYTAAGANYRGTARVVSSDTLTSLKSGMGYSALSSEAFARQLIMNHIRFDYNFNKGGAKNFFANMRGRVPYFRALHVALIDIGYMSGSFFSSKKGSALFQMMLMSNSKKDLAFQVFRFHWEYLQGLSNYGVNKNGWLNRLLRRYMLVSTGVFDVNYVAKNLNTPQKIKDFCFREMGYLLKI